MPTFALRSGTSSDVSILTHFCAMNGPTLLLMRRPARITSGR